MSNLESKLEKYRDNLEFIQEANKLVIRTSRYLHEEGMWEKINGIIKDAGGDWHSAGRDSHWSIPSEKKVEGKTLGEIHREQEKPADSIGSFKCPHCRKSITLKIGGM